MMSSMRRSDRVSLWCGVAVLFIVGTAAVVFLSSKRGDVDPVGAFIGSVSAILAVVAILQAAKAQRISDTDVAVWASWLAGEVRTQETEQRNQLLGRQDRTINLKFHLRPAPAHNARGARPHGHLADVVTYFRDLRPQRLVITGRAGAGKTVLAIELILSLLDNWEPQDPIPVRISAADWDPQLGVNQWLIAHLHKTFKLREATARELVKANRILPVIDGLDEMDREDQPTYSSRAAEALRVLNRYQDSRQKARLVLTCRTGQYDALTAGQIWARDAARVDLAPVKPDQASAFIEAAAGTDQLPRWQPVLHALNHSGHPLAEALVTPWRLTLAVTVYQEQRLENGAYLRDPADLIGHGSAEQIRDHLLELFIPATIAAATAAGRNSGRYRPEQVRAWLTVLARYLTANTTRRPFAERTLSSTDLVLHELWPLAGNRPRILALGLIALIGAVTTLAFALPFGHIAFSILMGVALSGGVGFIAWVEEPWPRLTHIDLAQMKSGPALVTTLGACPALGLLGGVTSGGQPVDLAAGLAAGLLIGSLLSLWGLSLMSNGFKPVAAPRDIVRDDLVSGTATLLVAALSVGLMAGIIGEIRPGGLNGVTAAAMAVAITITLGLLAVPAGGPGNAGLRYLLLLVCMAWRLPWRLGRFLHWCYTETGLIRIAGIAYQFRHRELQDYLATHPIQQ
jgi:hypothetical protein